MGKGEKIAGKIIYIILTTTTTTTSSVTMTATVESPS